MDDERTAPNVKEWPWDGGQSLLTAIDADGLMDPDEGWTHVLRPRLDVHPATLDAGRIAHQLAQRGVTWQGAPVTADEVGISWGGRVLVRADADPGSHWDAIDPEMPTPEDAGDRDADVELDAALAAVALLPTTPERRLLRALAAATQRRSG